MLAGNEAEIGVGDGLPVDAHRALPQQSARLAGGRREAKLLHQLADPQRLGDLNTGTSAGTSRR